MEERNLFDDTISMKRLAIKAKLIKDSSGLFKNLEKDRQVLNTYYGKRYRRKAEKSVYKDFNKGLKIINGKIPVYIELPKLKPEGNGSYSISKVKEDDSPKEVIIENVLEIEEHKLLESDKNGMK